MVVHVCVGMCMCGQYSFLPACIFTHRHAGYYPILHTSFFFSSLSIMPPLSMNEGFVWFFLQLSAVHCYPGFALCFLAWTYSCFFHLSLTEEIISDWAMVEEQQTNISYLWTRFRSTLQTIFVQSCSQNLFVLLSTTVQRVLINICGCFSELFNKWYCRTTELALFMWVHMCKCTLCPRHELYRHSTLPVLWLSLCIRRKV